MKEDTYPVPAPVQTPGSSSASKHGVQIDKATYDKVDSAPTDPLNNDPITYVNVWAHTVENQTIAARVDGGGQVYLTEGAGGNYFARLEEGTDFATLAPGAKPGSVQVSNLTDSPLLSQVAPIGDNVVITNASWNVATGTLEVAAQSSNQYDPPLLSISFEPDASNLTGNLTHNGAGLATGSYTANATSGVPGMPPIGVRISSLDGGTVFAPVTVSGGVSGGGQVETLTANAGADKAVNAGAVVILNGADSTGAIDGWSWSTLSLDVTWACVDAPLCSQIEVTTPDAATMTANGQSQITADFTLTVTAGLDTSSDTATITVTNPATQPDDTCTVVRSEFQVRKEFWRIEGTSDIADNQRIVAYLGGPVFDPATAKVIGEGRVDALGVWEVRTARGSASSDGTVPGAGDTNIHIESERGCFVTTTFISK